MLAAGNELRRLTDPITCVCEILIPRCRPEIRDCRVRGAEALPGLAELATQRAHADGYHGVQVASGRMLAEYTLGHWQIEEMFYCTTAAVPSFGSTLWCIDRAFGCRAQKGRLESALPLLGTVAASMQENPQWVSARRRELQRRAAAMSPPPRLSPGSGGPSILDVSRQMARDNDQFLKGVDQSFAARLHSPGLHAWTEAQRGVTGMENQLTGEQIDVPNGFLRYFEDNLGRVYGSNDMINDPYVSFGINVTELQPQRRRGHTEPSARFQRRRQPAQLRHRRLRHVPLLVDPDVQRDRPADRFAVLHEPEQVGVRVLRWRHRPRPAVHPQAVNGHQGVPLARRAFREPGLREIKRRISCLPSRIFPSISTPPRRTGSLGAASPAW